MQNILEQIEQWIKEFLIDCITGNLTGMFDEVNTKVGEIAAEVGKTPQSWNSGVFSMIQNLSETVIIPIAGLILTFVLCYELISMIIEKNNLHGDFDTFQLFKWIFKTFAATYIVAHTFDIVTAIFELSQYVVNQSAAVIGDTAALDFHTVIGDFTEQLAEMEVGELFFAADRNFPCRVDHECHFYLCHTCIARQNDRDICLLLYWSNSFFYYGQQRMGQYGEQLLKRSCSIGITRLFYYGMCCHIYGFDTKHC